MLHAMTECDGTTYMKSLMNDMSAIIIHGNISSETNSLFFESLSIQINELKLEIVN